MATRLCEYDFSRNSNPSAPAEKAAYPWEEWFDGDIWRLVRWEDFELHPLMMERIIRTRASSRKAKVTVRHLALDSNDKLDPTGIIIVQRTDIPRPKCPSTANATRPVNQMWAPPTGVPVPMAGEDDSHQSTRSPITSPMRSREQNGSNLNSAFQSEIEAGREFFTISQLASALGYSKESIRAWEAQGLLPPSGHRSVDTARPVAAGRSRKGRRLWTGEQIEGIIRLAVHHHVILNREPPTRAFARDVAAEFERELTAELRLRLAS